MEKMLVWIDGYAFYFDRELLEKFAYVMGEPVADVESLHYEILTYSETVNAAVEKYGIEQLVKMIEYRLRLQIKGA